MCASYFVMRMLQQQKNKEYVVLIGFKCRPIPRDVHITATSENITLNRYEKSIPSLAKYIYKAMLGSGSVWVGIA